MALLATGTSHEEAQRLSESTHRDEDQSEQTGGQVQEQGAKTQTEQCQGEHGTTAAASGEHSVKPFHDSIQALTGVYIQ